MLSQLGITVPAGTNMQLKNVAAVMVTAKLPAFGRQGRWWMWWFPRWVMPRVCAAVPY